MSDYYYDYDDEPYDPDYDDEEGYRVRRFADPGGDSALYAADSRNPRNLPCSTCGYPNRLTARDVAAGYHCDSCATALERGMDIDYYDGETDDDDGEDDL